MSYDLAFVAKRDAQSWDDAMEAAEQAAGDAARPADAGVWERIVADVREVLGDVTLSESAAWFEFDHEPSGIEVSLYDGYAAITVPYWYRGADAAVVAGLIYRLGEIVEGHTGLSGYDPQVELGLAEAATRPELAVAVFDRVADSFQQRGIRSPSNDG